MTTWMNLESIMLIEKSDRERQIPYDFTYMRNLKNKINEQIKQSRNRLIDTENKQVVDRRERSGGMGKIGEGD